MRALPVFEHQPLACGGKSLDRIHLALLHLRLTVVCDQRYRLSGVDGSLAHSVSAEIADRSDGISGSIDSDFVGGDDLVDDAANLS